MIELKLYRHVYHKDIFLIRNWSLCGGCPDTGFYIATKDVMRALIDANKPGFESWMSSFLDENGKTTLKAKITFEKEIEIDGYKGVCRKEVALPVTEFVLVKITESEV